MKSSTSVALVAAFAPLVLASPFHMARHADAQNYDVKYVTDTDVHTDFAQVTQWVTAGAPSDSATAAATTAAAASSAAAAPAESHHNGGHHWSWGQGEQSSAAAPPPPPPAPSTTSTTAEAAPSVPAFSAPAAPSTTSVEAAPSWTAAPSQPSTTAAAPSAPATTAAPAANNPGSNTKGMTYVSAVPAPASAINALTGDESYNAFDGTLQAAALNSTNWWRDRFQAPHVVWNTSLEQQIVDVNNDKTGQECQFTHTNKDCGQNIAAGYDGPTSSIDGWGGEFTSFNFTKPDWNDDAGHFSQLVWQDTTSIGCAAINCDDSHPGATAHGWFFVCNYYPSGNMLGEFPQNIKNQTHT